MGYPKGKKWRRFKISAQLVEKIKHHIKVHGLGPDDLLFAIRDDEPEPAAAPVLVDIDALGLTEPNDKG